MTTPEDARNGADAGGDGEPLVHVETVEEWGAWLAAHHDQAPGAWLVTWRSTTGRPSPGYEQAVIEALRFGWIDSVKRRLDDDRHMQRFSPRRPGSGWARTNKERIARLEAEDRLAPAGAAVLAAARADGSWTLLDAVENLEVPDDLAVALDAEPGARAGWDAYPRSVKRVALVAIVEAKRADTRARRIAAIAAKAARGER